MLLAELWLLLEARRCAREDVRPRVEELVSRLGLEIENRAKRGSPPDWTHCHWELDQCFVPLGGALRNLASAALALGLGGTLSALIVHAALISAFGSDGLGQNSLGLEEIALGIGVGLFGSLAGVGCNLVITLRFLPLQESRFEQVGQHALTFLQARSLQFPPSTAIAVSIKEELGRFRDTIGGQFGEAFSRGIRGFPEVVKKLGEQMDRLAIVVDQQGESIEQAVGDLRSSSQLVAASSHELKPAVEELAKGTAQLTSMPVQLSEILEAHRRAWVDELADEHQRRWDQLVALQERIDRQANQRETMLREAIADIQAGVENMPSQLVQIVHQMADDLGNSFGRQARDHVLELEQRLEERWDGVAARIENHEQEWRNNIGSVIAELLGAAIHPIENDLVPRLAAMADHMGASSEALGSCSAGLLEADRAWRQTLGEALEHWREAGQSLASSVQSIAIGKVHLEGSVEALGTSASHLERVASAQDSFRSTIQEGLNEVADRYLAKMQTLLDGLSSKRREILGTLETQSRFIEDLVREVLETETSSVAR